jgi:hypothetical protein
MKKTKKNQVIVVPTTTKTIKKKIKSTQVLAKSRSPNSKENTVSYYNCLVGQVANPLNDKVKITSLCHQCKHSKEKIAATQKQHKQQLVQQVAKDYLTFGQSLGHYLHADIVGCAKKLSKK